MGSPTGLRGWLAEHDPDLGDLRKAARTALVLPLLFAFGLEALGNESFALFAGFGVFAMLSFADFGGPLPRRARAYLVFAMAGAAIVVAGTFASQGMVAAGLGTIVVIFAVQQLAVFGGYWAAATIPATLAFVLAVMIPAPLGQALPQAGGWVAAGVVSAVAAVVLWPRRTRRLVSERAATVSDRLASLLSAWERGEPPERLSAVVDELADATHALFVAWDGSKLRPGGPAQRDQALVLFVDQVRQLVGFARALVDDVAGPVGISEDDRELVLAAIATIEEVGALLRGGPDDLDLEGLATTRAADLDRLVGAVSAAMVRGDGAAAVRRVDQSFAVRMLVHVTLSMAANARLMTGGDVEGVRNYEPPPTVPATGSIPATQRGLQILRSHLSLHSAWAQSTFRATAAIAVAVVLARAIDVQHGFWVALGTLSVLRSNAAGTAANAAQAVLGTLIGFGVTIPIFLLVGDRTALLWVLLPLTTFLSGWTPRVVHFVVGQASFTLFVVVLFNLVEPAGWKTGLVRVEDIVLGVVVAVGVGLILWPRGVATQVGSAVGEAYRAVAHYLSVSIDLTLGRSSGEQASDEVAQARRRAAGALVDSDTAMLLARAEARAEELPYGDMDHLIIGAARLRNTADAFGWVRSGLPPLQGCDRAVDLVSLAVGGTCSAVVDIADELAGSGGAGGSGAGTDVEGGPRAPTPTGADLAEAIGADAGAGGDGADATTVVALAFIARWIEVDRHVLDLARPSAAVLADLRGRPWWR